MFLKLFWCLTGGRPMKQLDYRFTDQVSGESVYRWQDKLGRLWLATPGDIFFRVRVEEESL